MILQQLQLVSQMKDIMTTITAAAGGPPSKPSFSSSALSATTQDTTNLTASVSSNDTMHTDSMEESHEDGSNHLMLILKQLTKQSHIERLKLPDLDYLRLLTC